MVKSKDLHFYSMAFWVYIELLAFYNRKQWKRQLILRNVSDSETLSRGDDSKPDSIFVIIRFITADED